MTCSFGLHLRSNPSPPALARCRTVTRSAMVLDKSHVVLHHHQGVLSGQEYETAPPYTPFPHRSCLAAGSSSSSSGVRLRARQHADLKKLFLTMGQQTGPGGSARRQARSRRSTSIQPIVTASLPHPGAQAGLHRFIPFIARARFSAHRQRFRKTVG